MMFFGGFDEASLSFIGAVRWPYQSWYVSGKNATSYSPGSIWIAPRGSVTIKNRTEDIMQDFEIEYGTQTRSGTFSKDPNTPAKQITLMPGEEQTIPGHSEMWTYIAQVNETKLASWKQKALSGKEYDMFTPEGKAAYEQEAATYLKPAEKPEEQVVVAPQASREEHISNYALAFGVVFVAGAMGWFIWKLYKGR